MTDASATGPGPEEHDALTPGATFAGHRIEGVIGHGGWAWSIGPGICRSTASAP